MEPPGIQKWQALLYREQCALYIDVEQLVKMLLDDFTEGNKFADAGVGENSIDSCFHLADGPRRDDPGRPVWRRLDAARPLVFVPPAGIQGSAGGSGEFPRSASGLRSGRGAARQAGGSVCRGVRRRW